MNHLEALGVLGLEPGVGWSEVRAAYRGLIRELHPDRAGDASTGKVARITAAYSLLEATWDDRPPPPPAPSRPVPTTNGHPPPGQPPRHGTPATGGATWSGLPVDVLGNDALAVDADAETAFFLLLDAAHDIGEVSFVDPSIGLIEAVCQFAGTPACSLVISLQGRQDHVEAFCTLETLDGTAPPPLHHVVEVLADLARQRMGATLDRPVDAPAEWLVDEQGRPGRPD
ncbi:MAG TPA: J domain-containing protein [Acidimicrobiales bacterium]|nr:J domain-containing protein [Acidimicrobiales bacterium]